MTKVSAMRKLAVLTVALCCVTILVLGTQSTAHASGFGGGGCTSRVTGHAPNNYNAYISIGDCISGTVDPVLGRWTVHPDSYITYTADNPNLWTTCHMYTQVFENVTQTEYQDSFYDCTSDARSNLYLKHYTANTVSGWPWECSRDFTAWVVIYASWNNGPLYQIFGHMAEEHVYC